MRKEMAAVVVAGDLHGGAGGGDERGERRRGREEEMRSGGYNGPGGVAIRSSIAPSLPGLGSAGLRSRPRS